MNVYFPASAMKTLDAKLAFVKGRGSQNLANAIAGEIALGNDADRLAGRDRYGRPQTPVKPRRGRYAGKTGPPLAPSGAASRVVSNFRSQPFRRGGQWRIVAGWEDVVSSAGVPFLPFHDTGTSRLPRRPIFGIGPGTWRRINARIKDFAAGIKKAR